MLRRKFILLFVLTGALAMLAAACQPGGNEPGAPVEEPQATETPAATEEEATPESQYPAAVEAARAQLAADLGIDVEAITVSSFETREWPDACLGLPEEGQMCAEVITPGYLVILNAEGETHRARTNQDGSVVVFEGEEGAEGEQSGLPEAVVVARQALAEKLGANADEIEVISYERQEWTDSCLGLGGPAESCLQVITPGWLVMLGFEGQAYEFHTDETGDIVRAADPLVDRPGAGLPEAVVTFERSGGIAGDLVKYFIYPDGQVEMRSGLPESSQPVELVGMAPEQVGPFVQNLKEMGFVELAGDYVPEETCCDRFFYTVTLRVQDEIYTIKALDGAEETPDAVWEIIDTVEQFIQDISETG
ncbi:MAG: hypothetical protein R3248_05735 [Candidatus Promineifilaceae bacterium]|nr:hypothetical protein [Candidatus Promineifilaceae bacterium]